MQTLPCWISCRADQGSHNYSIHFVHYFVDTSNVIAGIELIQKCSARQNYMQVITDRIDHLKVKLNNFESQITQL